MSRQKVSDQKGRMPKGNIAEFGPAFSALTFFLISSLALWTIPIRLFVAFAVMSGNVSTICHAETLSQASQLLAASQSVQGPLTNMGISIQNPTLNLVVESAGGNSLTQIAQGAPIPANCLPNGPGAPYLYFVSITSSCLIQPLSPGFLPVPGLTSPIVFPLTVSAPWDNTSIDPSTAKYFLEE